MTASAFTGRALACLLLWSAIGAHAADAVPAREAAVDRVFAAFGPTTPGCAVGVYRGGANEFQKGYGLANLETLTPISPQTVFDIGSTSKQFTAAAIVLLAQEGKLSLDEDVRSYLPELPDYGTPITIRQMLHHTAGLRDYVTLLTFADVDYGDVSTPAQALAMLARQHRLNNRPGERFLYSNSGYFLATQIVERVSGLSMRAFAQQRMFGPLGMANTFYKDDHAEVVARRASGYAPAEGGRYRVAESNWEETGDGGVQTSVADLSNWIANFAKPKVGGATFTRDMERVGVLDDGRPTGYALGLMVSTRQGLRMVHHGGSWAGYRAEVVRLPEADLGVATLCNNANVDASALAIATADVWLADTRTAKGSVGAEDQPEPAAAPASGGKPVAASAGTFRNAETGSLRRVEIEDGTWIEAFGGRFRLARRPDGGFDLVDGPFDATFRFLAGPAGEIELEQVAMERTTRFAKLQLHNPSASELARYVGDYDCEELGIVYRLLTKDGALYRTNRLGEPEVFRPLQQHEFSFGNLTIRFDMGTEGAPRAARLDIGRVKDVRCPRLPGGGHAVVAGAAAQR